MRFIVKAERERASEREREREGERERERWWGEYSKKKNGSKFFSDFLRLKNDGIF